MPGTCYYTGVSLETIPWLDIVQPQSRLSSFRRCSGPWGCLHSGLRWPYFVPASTGRARSSIWLSRAKRHSWRTLRTRSGSLMLPAIYSELEGNRAVGRLLKYTLTGSGNVTILAWTGSAGSYNICLPTDLTVYDQLVPPTIHSSTHRDG